MQRDAISVAPRKGAGCGHRCDQYIFDDSLSLGGLFSPRKVGLASYANAAAA